MKKTRKDTTFFWIMQIFCKKVYFFVRFLQNSPKEKRERLGEAMEVAEHERAVLATEMHAIALAITEHRTVLARL